MAVVSNVVDSKAVLLAKLQKYAFAKQWLHEQNYRMFKGTQEILNYELRNPIYRIEPLNTQLPIGERIVNTNRIKRIKHYNDLKKEGYVVVSKKLMTPWPNGLRVMYCIVPQYMGGSVLNVIPVGHEVEYEVTTGRFRLVGPNANIDGIGKWTAPKGGTVYDEESERKVRLSYDYYKENFGKVMDRARGIEVEETKYLPIKEIPLLLSESNELVCLPEGHDESVIGIVGERGKGKTFAINSISGRIYWKGHKNIAFINDRYRQTLQIATPISEPMFIQQLRRVREHPLPMPMVWLYPSTDTMKESRIFGNEIGLGHLISFPFNAAVDDYDNFFKGKKEWDLGQTAPILRLIAEELHDAKDMNDITEAIEKATIDKEMSSKYNIPNNSKGKVLRVMNDVFNQKMLDISTGVPSRWKIMDKRTGDTREYSPITACMACKLVPSLMTSSLFTKHYYPQYMKYLLDDLFNAQTGDDYFDNNKIVTYLIVDEITNIASTTNKSVAQESLVKCVTEGRPNRIGFVYTTQNYSVIDRRIRENTTHVLAFKLKKEAKIVGNDFSMEKHQEEDLMNLQKFEAMALTTDKFIIYNQQGERRESEPGEVFKGFVLPPVCEPSPPR